jgi:hypothetical protein
LFQNFFCFNKENEVEFIDEHSMLTNLDESNIDLHSDNLWFIHNYFLEETLFLNFLSYIQQFAIISDYNLQKIIDLYRKFRFKSIDPHHVCFLQLTLNQNIKVICQEIEETFHILAKGSVFCHIIPLQYSGTNPLGI